MTKRKNEPQPDSKPDNLVYEERLGAIRVTIWENHDKNGNVFHNVNVVRRYQVGSEWSNSDKFTGLSDVALLREAVELAQTWLRSYSLGGK